MQEHIPKRSWLLAIAIGVPALVVTGAFVGLFDPSSEIADAAAGTGQIATVDSGPPASAVDECNRSAELAAGDGTYVAPEAVSGAGASGEQELSARSGEVEERFATEQGASDTSVGISEKNRQSAKARSAYRDCMALKGYAS